MGSSSFGWFQRAARPFWLVLLGAIVGGLLLGCGRGSFIGRQYDDLTAYYNTFYNAQKAFEKGRESVSKSNTEIDRNRYLSIFPAPEAGSENASFEKAIEKSASVLREHPNSKWVDDALLLIGQARYYQQNYSGAVQKFREVIALEAEREGEARFWLARTLVTAERFSEAAEALRVGLEQEEDYGRWTAQMRLIRGELFVRQEAWTDAEASLAQGLDEALPDEVGARGAFLLGQVRETLENFEGAQRAYELVEEYDPRYPLEFAARLGVYEMQGRHDNAKRALQRLEDLERDDDTRAMRGQIAIVRARLFRALGRSEKAKQVLTEVLRGDEAPTGNIQGRIHYDLATLYRDTFEDFTQAAAHFDTASTNLPSSSGGRDAGEGDQRRGTPRAPSDVEGQADRFEGLADRAQAVARLDSLLRLGRMPPAEFRAYVQKLRKKRLKARKEEPEAQRRQQKQFRGGRQRGQDRREAGPSQKGAVQTRDSDAGFLFHRDPALLQEGRRQFQRTWGDRPLVDNWRRVNALQRGGQQAAQQQSEPVSGEEGQQERSAKQLVDISAVPRDSVRQAEMEEERAVARYELANALFRAASRPDSAKTWFRRILAENKDHPVARQALYGVAQVHRTQGDTAAAEKAFRRIIEEYSDTPYAERAREQLGLASSTSGTDLTASQADSAYSHAYETWQNGAPRQALDQFLAAARQYSETDVAPRALLAAGVVYHRAVQRDSSEAHRERFKKYVDSLAQSQGRDVSGAPESNGESASDAGTNPQGPSPSDTAAAQRRSALSPDTTSKRIPSSNATDRSQEASGEAPRRAKRAAPDTTRSDTARSEGAVRRPRQVDSTDAPSPAPSDSSTVVSDTASTRTDPPVDTTQTNSEDGESSDPFRLLLVHLTEQYGDSPAGRRAQTLLDHLAERRPVTTPNSGSSSDSTRSSAPSNPPQSDSLSSPAQGASSAPAPKVSPSSPADTSRDRGGTPR